MKFIPSSEAVRYKVAIMQLSHQELECIRFALTAMEKNRTLHKDVKNAASRMEREISHYLNPIVDKIIKESPICCGCG